MILRFFNYSTHISENFGYDYTATHLHFDGLILGVLASYLFKYKRSLVEHISKYKIFITLVTISFYFLTTLFTKEFMYIYGIYILGVLFSLIVLAFSHSKSLNISKSKATYLIANTSYSIYLTHALVIHIVLKMIGITNLINIPILVWLIMIFSIFFIGYLNFTVIEKPILLLRDKILTNSRKK